MATAFKIEGVEETVANLDALAKATQRNVLLRTLTKAGEPTAATASRLAPEARGILAFSIAVSPRLTARQRREGKGSWVEVHIGPAGGSGALFYASFQEFGTSEMVASPFMRPAWDSTRMGALDIIKTELRAEVMKAAARAARRAARLAAG